MDEDRNPRMDSKIAADPERLAKLSLMDDDFFSETLDGKTKAVQFILNTVLERDDLEVIETKTQRVYKSALKHSVSLDIWAKDRNGRICDIEIQRSDKGAGAKRARMHSSMIDRDLLEKGQDYDAAAETFVIFITENDIYDTGLPVYHIDRTIEELDHRYFGDEAHIVYVNGSFSDETHPVGRLVHDLKCSNADDMYYSVLADEVRYMKETEGGQRQMGRFVEEIVEQERLKTAERMLEDGFTVEKTAKYADISVEKVEELAASLKEKASA